MMMTRSMPLSFLKRLINLLITLCLLLLPESAFLVGRFPEQLSFYDLISSLTLGWSICILFYGFLYWKSFLLDELTTRIFFFVMALLVITLFKMPLLLISSVLFVTGFSLWIANYYRYEAGATYNTRDLGSWLPQYKSILACRPTTRHGKRRYDEFLPVFLLSAPNTEHLGLRFQHFQRNQSVSSSIQCPSFPDPKKYQAHSC